jgi:hypothetical protein
MDSGEGMEGIGRNWGDWLKLEVGLGRRTRRAIRPSVGFKRHPLQQQIVYVYREYKTPTAP